MISNHTAHMKKIASLVLLTSLSCAPGLIMAQSDKPTTATPVTAPAPAAEKEMTLKENFVDRREKWKTYEENLRKNDKTDGLISYEKEIIGRMLQVIEPINKSLANVDVSKDDTMDEGLGVMDANIVILSIYEDELKRAGQIRNILVRVQESKSADLNLEIRDLPALSTQIYEMQIKLSNALQQFRNKAEQLSRRSDEIIALKKKADEGEALNAKMEKLKKEHPDIYKSLMEGQGKK